MPRYTEIGTAFNLALRVEQNGRRTVTTADFVAELEKLNWHWDLKEANSWIENHVTTFRDISDQEGESRKFMVYNPNGGG
jgi:hypothetical protein